MTKDDLNSILEQDAIRNYKAKSFKGLNKNRVGEFIESLRITRYYYLNKNSAINKFLFRIHTKRLIRLQIKYGIEICYKCDIKQGLVLPHFGGITINNKAKIGKNCTILQGVTIGNDKFKGLDNLATIGDDVFIGAGSKIIGGITIGDNVVIGANSVVVKDVPDNAIIGGNPAKILKYRE